MRKTVSVNLGGMLFMLEEDAYNWLDSYLKRLEQHFAPEKDREEILNDIEGRLAELMMASKGSRQTVSMADVEKAIATMGDASQIESEGDKKEDAGNKGHEYSAPTTKRIYRDTDNRLLGGVCSGLGAYLDIDPVIIRVLFVFFTFIVGVSLLIYIILWIVVPEAKTVAQKLEMRGAPVNVSNISSFIRDEFEQVKSNYSKKRGK